MMQNICKQSGYYLKLTDLEAFISQISLDCKSVNNDQHFYIQIIPKSADGKYFFFTAYPQIKWNRYFNDCQTFADLQEITLQLPASDRTDIFWWMQKLLKK